MPDIDLVLRSWVACGWIRSLDAAFARFVQREAPQADPLLVLAAALASHQLARGHSCLDLQFVLADPDTALGLSDATRQTDVQTPGQLLAGVTLANWLAALRCEGLVQAGAGHTPLVLDGHRLYLRRYWQYEAEVRDLIALRTQRSADIRAGIDRTVLASLLDRLFGVASAASPTDWQRLACALAAGNAFTVITGGPGTGKTTTVLRLLAVLQRIALADGPHARPLVIRLAAPTGKAAARLSSSIQRALGDLPWDSLGNDAMSRALRASIPSAAVTLHRLLGSRPGSRRPRHDASNPLPLDVLVVDEVSMVDLEMMAATLAALRPAARIVLLGDKDQLASVEAGTVLGELCRRAAQGHYTPQTADWLAGTAGAALEPSLCDAQGTALDQSVAMLRHSHRFGADSGIGRLARAVNEGDALAAQRTLDEGRADLAVLEVASTRSPAWRATVIGGPPVTDADADAAGGHARYLHAMRKWRPADGADAGAVDAWALRVLGELARFQVLCAVREGPWGVAGLNEQIAHDLCRDGWIERASGWYAGRPVLVTRNDYALGLMNGDVGVALDMPAAHPPSGPPAGPAAAPLPGLRVAFDDGQGGIRWIAPSRLASVETVFALTVHKSQGSEYAHVVLVLPPGGGPILTRELLYTGITRASARITLAGPAVLAAARHAMQRPVFRASGLVRDADE